MEFYDQIKLSSINKKEKTMHALKLLHNHLSKSCEFVHSKRINSLMCGAESLVHGMQLTVTGLGRSAQGNATVKSKIKQMNGLIGNEELYSERKYIYSNLISWTIGSRKELFVIVDWSPCGNRGFHMLRAGLVASGRSLTLYDEVHEEAKVNSPKVEKTFLRQLYRLIPKDCHVIVITDAGFKSPWFKSVEELEWDWIGRQRTNAHYKKTSEDEWNECISLYKNAKVGTKKLGEIELTKKHKFKCQMFVHKEAAKGRKRRNKNGSKKRGGMSPRYSESQSESWLLVSSLKEVGRVVSLYKKRMQIEESFRDLKDDVNGFGFKKHKTRSAQRLEMMLLIATIATLIIWVTGLAGEKKNLQRYFQANTVRRHRVLSLANLGRQIIIQGQQLLKMREIREVFTEHWGALA